MRLLHTSDWHLGRQLHGVPLLDHQAAFVDWLVDVVASEGIDAVVVAGDLYDRAIPPLDAVALLDEALARLVGAGVPAVLIAGNHDSAGRLAFGSRLLDAAGVHLRSTPAGCGEPVVLADEHGDVAVYPLPYLEPTVTWSALEADGPRHEAVLDAAMARVRADLAGRGAGTRSVAVAHAFVVGGQASDSERDVSVGGSGAVAAEVFAGVDVVALGHLHGPQQPAERITYSGSPLAFSFSEARHTKSVSVLELGADGALALERLPTPVPRRLHRVRGTLDDLLADPGLDAHVDDWLEVTLTDARRPADPMARLRARFPHVLRLGLDPEGVEDDGTSYAQRMEGRTDLEVCEGFVEHVRGEPTDADEQALLDAALVAQRQAEVA